MKAIILAAGKSSRLYPLTKENPKCLLEISKGLSIIEFQISILNELGINDIHIVTGFKSNKIKDRLKDTVEYHYYDNYKNTNNLHTLNFISDELDDDVLILFSDVIISKKLLSICKQSKDDFNLLIDKNNVTDKTMRVLIKNKLIVDLGAHISVIEGDANFIGIAKYSKNGALRLKKMINKICDDKKYINEYYTIALTELAKIGGDINFTSNNARHYWNEIDFLEDFIQVKKDFNKLKKELYRD